MKNIFNVLFLFILFFIAALPAGAVSHSGYPIDPHDSLLFDGEYSGLFDIVSNDGSCFIKVLGIKGTAKGRVIEKQIFSGCTKEFETLYVAKDKDLEKGDKLVEGTDIQAGPDSKIDVMIMVSGPQGENSAMVMTVGANSVLTLPMVSTLCTALKVNHPVKGQIKVKKGKIKVNVKSKIQDFKLGELDLLNLRDDPEMSRFEYLEPQFIKMMESIGKNSSVTHKKTEYTHEVKIEGGDTVDVICVYEGSVEITYIKTDNSEEEEDMTKKIEQLGEDVQSDKITAEELQTKMTEFQIYGANLSELITPLEVNEGSKCIITKNSRTVEPLGAGDEDIK